MPQLNPNPWLFIMTISWLTFSLIIQPKLLSFMPTNSPLEKTLTNTKPSSWPWPWT
uniref:ATP synthase complex subunit 8 n=1 Tax=Pampa curvipennis TaxID=3150280 RepID=E5L952_PAMCU|nr:ATP syntase subunit 8 [Campylopterus curvipennis]ADQ27509.1 ATP syntase subunit 8 [Campylopterus curvipennis]ADQ27512.1 ATP syntase subunit 8 [Campylopterus curvipennis]ADQ27521.1 ATP syntase subunit 8 [Campylopterus curvipennis]ADQ27524.1 ATP syntase subunit 8 [Campylopterus curvipennis]